MYSFGLLNVEEKYKNCLEVESARLKERKNKDGSYNDHKHGLFSEIVFGTTKDYQCSCGKYKGIMSQGIVCENCGVMVQSSQARRNTFGKINLGEDVYLVNPTPFNLLINDFKFDKSLKTHAYNVLVGKEWISRSNGEISKKYVDNCYTGPHAFREKIYPEILNSISNNSNNDDYLVNVTLKKIDECLFTYLIPVIPPDLRPIIKGSGNSTFLDVSNKYYMLMINYVNFIKDSPILPYDKIGILQSLYFEVSEILLKKLSSKTGIMRKYLLAKRVDYSARAVIIPDYTLNIDQIDVSYHIIKEIFKPALLPKLSTILNISELEALDIYENFEYEDIIFKLTQEYKNYPVIINRQPSLHRPSILVFFIRNIIKDYVVAIPPISTEPFNADFDGDQMALYFPMGGAAYNESLNMVPYKNIFLPSNGELAFEFKEDLVLGMYKLSMTKEGMDKIFKCVPEKIQYLINDYRDKKFTGKVLNEILSILIDKVPNKTMINIINDWAHISHDEAKISISLSDYANANEEDKDLNNPVTLMIEAGARGNWTQLKQISSGTGFISDVEGKIIPTNINSSLLKGLTPYEYFVSCYGALKGIIDSSRNTSVSGYLTRRLIYLISNLELSEDEWDCGSNNYLKLNLNKDYIKMYMYRVVKLDPESNEEFIITKDNYKDFIDKDIYLRSPLTCLSKDDKICHKCYGYLFKKHNTRQIGYIAAQSIGERASQLTLRTKHISGATDIQLPEWIKIENGYIITKIPVIITSSGNNSYNIINSKNNEEVDLSYCNIEIICEKYDEEIINENIDINYNNQLIENNDEDEFNIEDLNNESIVKYTINETGKIARINLMSHDVIASVNEFGKFLKRLPNIVNNDMLLSDVLLKMIDTLGINNIHSVHFELLLSMFARNAKDSNKLYRNNPDDGLLWYKENEVLNSMLLQSLAFERFDYKLKKLLVSDPDTLNWKNSIFILLTSFEFGSKLIKNDPKVNNLFGNIEV